MSSRQEAINRESYFPIGLSLGMDLATNLRALMRDKGLSESELARLSGVSQPTINALLNANQKSSKFLPEIASALGVTPGDIDPRHAVQSQSQGSYRPPPQFIGERDLPVYSAVEGGPGELVVSTDPIDYVPRPWYLGQVKDGYAVVVTGESMVPAFAPGDMAIVNPRLPPQRDKHHILISEDVNGEFRATIKKLVNWSASEWSVEQYNPPNGRQSRFRLARSDWPRALRVVGKWEGN